MSTETRLPIQIRLATAADVSPIAAVLHRSFVEFQSQYTTEGFAATVLSPEQVQVRLNEGPIWIALESQNVVGTVSALATDIALYIRGMAVDPSARGKGIGQKLLECAEAFALQHKYDRLLLSTTPFLAGAIHLYKRNGFARSNEGPGDLFGTPLFTMSKYVSH
jgi:ribosomal protein S18 acetylase RimI-like enzyme